MIQFLDGFESVVFTTRKECRTSTMCRNAISHSAEGQNRTADKGIFSPSQARAGLCCDFQQLILLIKIFLFLVSFGSAWQFLVSMVKIWLQSTGRG
jgi:hypothetical protein